MKMCPNCSYECEDFGNFCERCGHCFSKARDEIASLRESVSEHSKNNVEYSEIKKPDMTYRDREATVSLVLSIIGLILFFALPLQLLGLGFGISGIKAENRKKRALVGIALSSAGLLAFTVFCFITVSVFDIGAFSEMLTYYGF